MDDTNGMRQICTSHPVTVRLEGDVWECRTSLESGVCGQLLKGNYLLDELNVGSYRVGDHAGAGTDADPCEEQVGEVQVDQS